MQRLMCVFISLNQYCKINFGATSIWATKRRSLTARAVLMNLGSFDG